MSLLGGILFGIAIVVGALVITCVILLAILWFWLIGEEKDLAGPYEPADWIWP